MGDKIRELDPQTRYYSIVENFTSAWGNEHGGPLVPENKLILSLLTELWNSSEKKPLFEEINNFEHILLRDKKYRDHFIHSFNVFLMGYYILNKIKKYGEIDNILKRSNSPDLTWMLASTFHDIAYPLQNIDYWINDILNIFIGINPHISISISNLMPPIYDHFLQQISRENRGPLRAMAETNDNLIDWKFYNTLTEKMYEKDHGVYGGVILAHKLAIRDGFYERPNRQGDFSRNHLPACHAICCHTLDYAIHFRKHPYAFLLKLCDEIQDWGRPSTNTEREIIKLIDIKIDNNLPIVIIELDLNNSSQNILIQKLSKDKMIADDNLHVKLKNKQGTIFHEF